jgi:signal transduction histidine kinase
VFKLHSLLARQLKNTGLSELSGSPDSRAWLEILERINKTYLDGDQERYLLERSLMISSHEMQERWEAMQIMEERWRSLVSCAPDIIMILDDQGQLQFANRPLAANPLQGTSTDIYADICVADRAKFSGILRQVFDQGAPMGLEIKSAGTDKDSKTYSVRLAPFYRDGKITGVILVASDLTEKRRLQAEIEESTHTAQAVKMATLGEMAAGIAHEINNPLSIIHALGGQMRELLSDEVPNIVELNGMASKIEDTVIRITKIVKALKSFSRDDSNDPLQDVLLQEIIHGTLELCGEKFKHRNIALSVSVEPATLAIRCHSVQFSQVLLNLLGNAYDAIDGLPEKEKWVRVEGCIKGSWAVVTVTDCGHGISPELEEKIMRPFFTTKGMGKGTGLGLSIAKRIVETYGGTIGVDRESKNTRFEIRLPR